jgi:hypothetical protein
MSRSKPTIANLMVVVLFVAVFFSLVKSPFDPILLVGIAVLAILSPYVFGPLLIRRTHWTAVDLTLESVDLLGPGTPAEVSRYFREACEGLAPLGFDLVHTHRLADLVPNAVGFTALFRNRTTPEVAKLIGAVADNGVVRNVSLLLFYSTEFTDGTEVLTSNSRTARVFPPLGPPVHVFTFPQVAEFGRLHAIHRALVDRFEGGRIRHDALGDDPAAYHLSKEMRHLDHRITTGYSYLDEERRILRLTWKGAVLVAWKLLWPIKQIGLVARRLKAARLLRELEWESSAI